MMNKYICNILYSYKEELWINHFSTALKLLGFRPMYVSVFFNEFKESLDDVLFEESTVFSILKEKPGLITVKNKSYDEGGSNYWFRFRLSLDTPSGLDTYSMEWSNSNLDFLINNDLFQSLLLSEGMIYSYCYDQIDCTEQSDTDIERLLENESNLKYKIKKDNLGHEIIDTSKHWGRCISVRGFLFIAAPLMWYGKKFYEIISEEELMRFSKATSIDRQDDVVFIKLFDLYDLPSKEENRARQKEFWKQLKLEKRIKDYGEKSAFDFTQWLKKRAAGR